MLLLLMLVSLLTAYYFLRAAFDKEFRSWNPSTEEFVKRSERVDKLVRVACLCLGFLSLLTGVLMLILSVSE